MSPLAPQECPGALVRWYIPVMPRDLAELQQQAIDRGFTIDYGSHPELFREPIDGDLRVVETVPLDGGTDPGDDATMYLIESEARKGYLILSDSFHADPRKAVFIDELLARSKRKGDSD